MSYQRTDDPSFITPMCPCTLTVGRNRCSIEADLAVAGTTASVQALNDLYHFLHVLSARIWYYTYRPCICKAHMLEHF